MEHFAVGSPNEEELIRCDRGDLLNALGSEGWELASVVIRPKDEWFREERVICVFKRRVVEPRKPEWPTDLDSGQVEEEDPKA
jgi:Domain of unknown function (DUF4177)